jgi:hypothetical protein
MRPSAEILAVKGFFLRRNSRRMSPFALIIVGPQNFGPSLLLVVTNAAILASMISFAQVKTKSLSPVKRMRPLNPQSAIITWSAILPSVFVVKSPNYEILSA